MPSILTGNTRHRQGLFGRLVLQVEERRYGVTEPFPYERDGMPYDFTMWRDAKVIDLAAVRNMGRVL